MLAALAQFEIGPNLTTVLILLVPLLPTIVAAVAGKKADNAAKAAGEAIRQLTQGGPVADDDRTALAKLQQGHAELTAQLEDFKAETHAELTTIREQLTRIAASSSQPGGAQ